MYKKVLALDNNKCRIWACGKEGTEVHHIVPRAQGGPDEKWNLITLCHFHHAKFTNKTFDTIEQLSKLKNKTDFRWERALIWHAKRKGLHTNEDE